MLVKNLHVNVPFIMKNVNQTYNWNVFIAKTNCVETSRGLGIHILIIIILLQ